MLDDTEAKKYIRYKDEGKTIEIISPQMKGILRIKGSKVNIAPNPLRFEELQYIESAIVSMKGLPDFGYEEDNFVLDRHPDAPRNWKLLTDFVWNRDKYMWLQNHLALRKLRLKQEALDDARKVNYHKKLSDKKEKENQAKRKGHTLVHAEKEMDELVKIKKDLMGQSNYLRKFKKLNNEINRHLVKAKPEP